MFNVGFTGSRNIDGDNPKLSELLFILNGLRITRDATHFHHGDCHGSRCDRPQYSR